MPATRIIQCRELQLEIGKRTLIMGILNVTPDSFSDGGKYARVEAAVQHARQMVEEGADMIDVGGESTRPGASTVSLEEELRRVIPVIEALRQHIAVPISVDTYKSEVARQALEAGAHIVNDVWRLTADPQMAQVVARYGCPVILMHNRKPNPYTRLTDDVCADLRESIQLARAAGIDDRHILLDPGIGFAKNYEENLELMNRLSVIAGMGFPVVLGTSRKRFIRHTLDLPTDDVVEGTIATNVLGIAQGCDIVRVHDVKAMKRAAAMADAILRR